MSIVAFQRTSEIYWTKSIMKNPFLYYNFNNGEVLDLQNSASTRHKRDASGKFMYSAVTLPPVSVTLLQLDSYESAGDSKENITASLL